MRWYNLIICILNSYSNCCVKTGMERGKRDSRWHVWGNWVTPPDWVVWPKFQWFWENHVSIHVRTLFPHVLDIQGCLVCFLSLCLSWLIWYLSSPSIVREMRECSDCLIHEHLGSYSGQYLVGAPSLTSVSFWAAYHFYKLMLRYCFSKRTWPFR